MLYHLRWISRSRSFPRNRVRIPTALLRISVSEPFVSVIILSSMINRLLIASQPGPLSERKVSAVDCNAIKGASRRASVLNGVCRPIGF